jgi:hypothetical protein
MAIAVVTATQDAWHLDGQQRFHYVATYRFIDVQSQRNDFGS